MYAGQLHPLWGLPRGPAIGPTGAHSVPVSLYIQLNVNIDSPSVFTFS